MNQYHILELQKLLLYFRETEAVWVKEEEGLTAGEVEYEWRKALESFVGLIAQMVDRTSYRRLQKAVVEEGMRCLSQLGFGVHEVASPTDLDADVDSDDSSEAV